VNLLRKYCLNNPLKAKTLRTERTKSEYAHFVGQDDLQLASFEMADSVTGGLIGNDT
jgi:hypothetical protein